MPTLRDIARITGVSIWTVSTALRDDPRVAAETRARIKALAAEYHYIPKTKLAATASRALVGVIAHRCFGPEHTEILEGLIEQAYSDRLSLAVLQVHADDASHFCAAIKDLIAAGVKGLVFLCGHAALLSSEMLLLMRSAGAFPIEAVHADQTLTTGDRVVVPLQAVHRMAIEHLQQFGHRRVACLTDLAKDAIMPVLSRELASHGMVLAGAAQACDGPSAVAAFDNLHRRRFTALYLPDAWAWPVLFRARELGLRIPDDLSLIGNARLHVGSQPPMLTTIDQHLSDIGRQAAVLLRRRLDAGVHPCSITPETIELQPALIIRASCAPPRRNPRPDMIRKQHE